jgi:transglutaminase-like putative cysteine protease
MQIRIGFDIVTRQSEPTPMVLLLHVRPEIARQLIKPDELHVSPAVETREFIDGFGNRSVRLMAPSGPLRITTDALIQDKGEPDIVVPDAIQHAIGELPDECLPFLLASRYCEVDKLADFAWETFRDVPLGWTKVQAVCDFVHHHVTFGYEYARSTKSAVDVLEERTGVCRDFQHLAITLCRCLGIPSRYATGYLSDIGFPTASAMDFSAWFQVYLSGQWFNVDARFNTPRIGRFLMAVGRDAADCALITSFGAHVLEKFEVTAE